MALTKNNDYAPTKFVNISNGRLYTTSKDNEKEYFKDIFGYIVGVEFKEDEYNGKKFQVAKFNIVDGDEKLQLKMRCDSGYFRGLVNCIKSGNTKEKFLIAPHFKEENDKTKTTCFVKQEGKTLKHFHTMANQGDLPLVEKINFKGQEVWDSTKQIEYWKNWISKQQWYITTTAEPQDKDDEFFEDDLPF